MLEISDGNLGKSPVYTEAQLEKLCFGCDIREGVESFATQGYMEYLLYSYPNSNNKPVSKWDADLSAYVGVIKDKTCKDDMELKIYYDCDDKGSKTGPKDFY